MHLAHHVAIAVITILACTSPSNACGQESPKQPNDSFKAWLFATELLEELDNSGSMADILLLPTAHPEDMARLREEAREAFWLDAENGSITSAKSAMYLSFLAKQEQALAEPVLQNILIAPKHFKSETPGASGYGDIQNLFFLGALGRSRQLDEVPWFGKNAFDAWVNAMAEAYKPGESAEEYWSNESILQSFLPVLRNRLLDEYLQHSSSSPLMSPEPQTFITGWLMATGMQAELSDAHHKVDSLSQSLTRDELSGIASELKNQYPVRKVVEEQEYDLDDGFELLGQLLIESAETNKRGGVALSPDWYQKDINVIEELVSHKEELATRYAIRDQQDTLLVERLIPTIRAAYELTGKSSLITDEAAEAPASDVPQNAIKMIEEAQKIIDNIDMASHDAEISNALIAAKKNILRYALLESKAAKPSDDTSEPNTELFASQLFELLRPIVPVSGDVAEHRQRWYPEYFSGTRLFADKSIHLHRLGYISVEKLTAEDEAVINRVVSNYRTKGWGRDVDIIWDGPIPKYGNLIQREEKEMIENLAILGMHGPMLLHSEQYIDLDGQGMRWNSQKGGSHVAERMLIRLAADGDPDAVRYVKELGW